MLNIIFRDDSILVIDKPSGLITISDNSNEETLATLIQTELNIDPQVSIVHRLDKDTSGVMVIALNQKTHDILQNQFKDRKVKKEYLALVHGSVEKAGIVDVNLGRVPGGGNKFVADKEGRLAATAYEPKELLVMSSEFIEKTLAGFTKIQFKKLRTMNYELFTLVVCRPLTGRTHQIRVHLKYINHPLVADPLYVGRKTLKLDNYWCPRLFLHAAKIGFYHPVSGKWMEYESPLAEDLEKVLNNMSSPT